MNDAWSAASQDMYKAQQNQQGDNKDGQQNNQGGDHQQNQQNNKTNNGENVTDVDFEEVK
jgi:molecular chaperone DnaK